MRRLPHDRPSLTTSTFSPSTAPGRLDRDSEGLLILSDDPQLRAVLTEPRHSVPRTYLAQVEGLPNNASIDQLCRGVMVKGRRTRPAEARVLEQAPDLPPRPKPIRIRDSIPDCWIELKLREGRNRQVRRMTAAVGHPTLRLVRIAVGPITLAGLEPGRWRELSSDEVTSLAPRNTG